MWPFLRPTVLALSLTLLAGCNTLQRLSTVGEVPELRTIEDPSPIPGPGPMHLPMPPALSVAHAPNSLWRPGSTSFLKDQRASEIGDIVTVEIDISDGASISNTSQRQRSNSESAGASHFLGFESSLGNILPDAVDPSSLIGLDSDSDSTGSGSVNRDETINLDVAALVTQVLPNGNLVIAGRQEIRVNYEVRELLVAGVIRPEDIASTNRVPFDKIAEARIAYGGRGQISDVQQPRYGQQVFDILWPF